MKITIIIIIIMIGIISGFYIGYKLNESYIYHGPNSKKIKKIIYKNKNGKCYKLKPIVYICPISLSMKKDIKNDV